MRAKGLRWSDVLESAPESWKRVPLGEVFEERKEQNHPDLPLLSVTAEHGVVPRDSLTRRDTSNPDKSRYLRVCPGDIVYNTMRMWQGVSALASEEGIVSPAYTVCTPRPSIDATFASYLLKVQALVNVFRNRSQGLVDDTLSLRFDEFAKIRIPLPPLAEQKRIAEIIGSVDEAIQATRAVIEQTRKVKQGMLYELLTRGIGHTRFKQTEIGELPEGWEVVSLGEILRGIVSGRSPSANSGPAGPNETGVLKVSAVGFGEFYPHENKVLPQDYPVEDKCRVRRGDLLISRANTKELVGAACVVPDGDYNLMLSDKTLRLDVMRDRIVPEFAGAVLISRRVRSFLQANAAGTSRSMKNVSQDVIRSIRLPLPPLSEQLQIVDTISANGVYERSTSRHLVRIESVKRGIMEHVLIGRTQVVVAKC